MDIGTQIPHQNVRINVAIDQPTEHFSCTVGHIPSDVSGYRRKTISFANTLNRALGFDTVQVASYGVDGSAFAKRYDPNHPAAGADGFVLLPNVNPLIEMADMREAMRSYEANLSVVEASKSMLRKTIQLLAG
jgi:flagellar basal-body rod protein FlgC